MTKVVLNPEGLTPWWKSALNWTKDILQDENFNTQVSLLLSYASWLHASVWLTIASLIFSLKHSLNLSKDHLEWQDRRSLGQITATCCTGSTGGRITSLREQVKPGQKHWPNMPWDKNSKAEAWSGTQTIVLTVNHLCWYRDHPLF